MELWFDRAMKTDGNDYAACLTKLDWLDPKWHGDKTGAEMLAFGQACRATRNSLGGLTLLAAEAHWRYANYFEPEERTAYLRKPEVWSEVKTVFDEYLQSHQLDYATRSKYAAICYFGAHFAEAHAQFQTLGDFLTVWPHYPNLPLESLKELRDDAARIVARRAGGAGAPGQDRWSPPKP